MVVKEALVIVDEGAIGLTEALLMMDVGRCDRLTNFIFIIIVGNLDKKLPLSLNQRIYELFG